MLGVIICLVVIVAAQLNPRESLLLSLVLTIVSMLGSWLASRFYAEISFNENLRTFALKASEKVDNLSKELDRLALYLQQELDDDDYKNAVENLMAKEYRIEAAIHGTDHGNGVSFDQEAGSAVGCRTVCDAIGADTHATQHAAKRAENRQARDVACSGLAWTGRPGVRAC
jgi:hypothetical protein